MNGLSSSPYARQKTWWQRPWFISLLAVIVILAAALGWPLLAPPATEQPGASNSAPSQLPWQVEASTDGSSQVFGLVLGATTLAQVQERWGDEVVSGLIAPHGEAASLEAYVDSFKAGFVTGKLVLAFEADDAWLVSAKARSPRNDVGEGGRSRRYALAEEDRGVARQSRLVGLAFLPSARLDEATLVQRFGQPAERLKGSSGEIQLLYPAQGVAIAVPDPGAEAARTKVVIQYVAPSDFEARLRVPLVAPAKL